MAEYIEREAALRFHLKADVHREKITAVQAVADAIAEYIKAIPAADVEPVRHGRWEMKPDPYGWFDEIPVCSACGCTTKWREKYLFCPNCGARMDKDGGGDV